MIKLFSVRVRCCCSSIPTLAARCVLEGYLPRSSMMACSSSAAAVPAGCHADALSSPVPLLAAQDKQKKDEAMAEANGVKPNKLSAGELRIQKGELLEVHGQAEKPSEEDAAGGWARELIATLSPHACRHGRAEPA